MAKDKDMTIKDAIGHMVDAYKIRRKFDETALVTAWPDIMGAGIANRTQQLYIRDRKLFVKVESAVVRHELVLLRSQIVKRMNEHVGQEVIDEVVVLS